MDTVITVGPSEVTTIDLTDCITTYNTSALLSDVTKDLDGLEISMGQYLYIQGYSHNEYQLLQKLFDLYKQQDPTVTDLMDKMLAIVKLKTATGENFDC